MAIDYAAQLAEAKAALHALIMGDAIVSVTINGRQTQFKAADEVKLRKYIGELEGETGNAAQSYRGPIRHFR